MRRLERNDRAKGKQTRRRRTRLCVLCLCMLMFAATQSRTAAQEIDPPVFDRIDVVSEPRGAEVYVGDSLLGRTPLRISVSLAGKVRLYYPSRRSWNAQEGRLDQPLPAAGKGVAMVRFLRYVHLRTLPHGARVFRGDSLRHVVTFGGRSGVTRLSDQPICLRFHLRSAELYSFAFRPGAPTAPNRL